MEQLLHYVWKHKLYPLKPLTTTDGLPLEIIDPGLHNPDAGPDFFNAKIKINGVLWVGNIEIHLKTSDWYVHHHDQNKTYDTVILHVASDIDSKVYRSNGEAIPQMELHFPPYLWDNYVELIKTSHYPACYRLIPHLPKILLHSWMDSLRVERFEQKTTQIKQRLERCNFDWERAFFLTLARNFGFATNSDVFELWAQSIPLGAVNKHRDDLFQIEAIFFGQSGLLKEYMLEENPSMLSEPWNELSEKPFDEPLDKSFNKSFNKPCDESWKEPRGILSEPSGNQAQDFNYPERLWKEYAYLRHKFDLKASENLRWKLLRLRPANFPHIRIAQLAKLYYSRQGLLSQLLEAETIEAVRKLLRVDTSAYWNTHYTFTEVSPCLTKTLSDRSIDLLIINTVVPFLYAYGKHKEKESLINRASQFLEKIKAENNFITRMWNDCGLTAEHAGDSQALIQLKKNYCDPKKCLFCRIGYEYFKKKE